MYITSLVGVFYYKQLSCYSSLIATADPWIIISDLLHLYSDSIIDSRGYNICDVAPHGVHSKGEECVVSSPTSLGTLGVGWGTHTVSDLN